MKKILICFLIIFLLTNLCLTSINVYAEDSTLTIEEDTTVNDNLEKSSIAIYFEEEIMPFIINLITSSGIVGFAITLVFKWLKKRTKELADLGDEYGLSNQTIKLLLDKFEITISDFNKYINELKENNNELSDTQKSLIKLVDNTKIQMNNLNDDLSNLKEAFLLIVKEIPDFVNKGVAREVKKVLKNEEK